MTSQYATNAVSYTKILGNKATVAQVERQTGYPLEGQWPISYGTASAGELLVFNQVQIVGGNITISNATAKNAIGRQFMLFVDTPAANTVTLSGSLFFNEGATHIATFSSTLESYLGLIFVTNAAGATIVKVTSSRNVTFA